MTDTPVTNVTKMINGADPKASSLVQALLDYQVKARQEHEELHERLAKECKEHKEHCEQDMSMMLAALAEHINLAIPADFEDMPNKVDYFALDTKYFEGSGVAFMSWDAPAAKEKVSQLDDFLRNMFDADQA